MKIPAKILTALLLTAVSLAAAPSAAARGFNDKLVNRPYADNRRWHLGFSVGLHSQDLAFTHNGYISDEGRQWFMSQPTFQPGFNVTGLFALRLNNYFSLRFSPGIFFGSRELKMRDALSGDTDKQTLKTAQVVLPVDLKFAAVRWRNARPYLISGVMPAFDVGKKRPDLLKLKTYDTYLSIGFGCDFYLPYFKFIPEVRFCFGLSDIINHNRPDLVEEPQKLAFTRALDKAKSRMVVFTFYFE